ncbi:MAG: hypothetical protein ATN32_09890 [Candidatus Epulonipiscium fishelsonii]|nr:MAG: hypothetical protein ATN32_09890 [Epulopiscium sp. AS2M-Bin002]
MKFKAIALIIPMIFVLNKNELKATEKTNILINVNEYDKGNSYFTKKVSLINNSEYDSKNNYFINKKTTPISESLAREEIYLHFLEFIMELGGIQIRAVLL